MTMKRMWIKVSVHHGLCAIIMICTTGTCLSHDLPCASSPSLGDFLSHLLEALGGGVLGLLRNPRVLDGSIQVSTSRGKMGEVGNSRLETTSDVLGVLLARALDVAAIVFVVEDLLGVLLGFFGSAYRASILRVEGLTIWGHTGVVEVSLVATDDVAWVGVGHVVKCDWG